MYNGEGAYSKMHQDFRQYLHDLMKDLASPRFMTLKSEAFHLWLGLQGKEELKVTLEVFEQHEMYEECIQVKKYIDEYE